MSRLVARHSLAATATEKRNPDRSKPLKHAYAPEREAAPGRQGDRLLTHVGRGEATRLPNTYVCGRHRHNRVILRFCYPSQQLGLEGLMQTSQCQLRGRSGNHGDSEYWHALRRPTFNERPSVTTRFSQRLVQFLGSTHLGLERHHVCACAKSIQIVRPPLHHLPPLSQVRRPVVGTSVCILHCMG